MQVSTNQGVKLNGFYRGKVVRHCVSGYGRCKVFIPGVYPDEKENDPDSLPDAEQISPLFGGSLDGNGVFSYPNLGSIVICGFWNGDQNMPFFFGSTLGGPDSGDIYSKIDSLKVDPKKVESGDDATLHSIQVHNSTIDIYERGDIEIKVLGDNTNDNRKVIIDGRLGQISISTTKKVQVNSPEIAMTAPGKITMEAGNILINASNNLVLQGQKIIEGGRTGIKEIAPTVDIEGTTMVMIKGPKHGATTYT